MGIISLKNKLTERFFEELFDVYFERLCLYAYSFVHDSEVARDICQDTFIVFWENFKGSDDVSHFVPFLYKSVKNACLNSNRHEEIKRCHERTVVALYDVEMGKCEKDNELVCRILEAAELLPEQCKRVFLLNSVDEMKYKEIADELGISVNTVKTHLAKAFRFLRDKMANEEKNRTNSHFVVVILF